MLLLKCLSQALLLEVKDPGCSLALAESSLQGSAVESLHCFLPGSQQQEPERQHALPTSVHAFE